MKSSSRILLCTTGLSPQVVTETLYALAVQSDPAWVPTEVRLLTTKRGAANARLNLLSSQPGWFHRLCDEYELPPIRFEGDSVQVIRDQEGRELEDISTQEHNDAAADLMTEVVRQLTSDPATELHVSIAGGRKTMGYYLGYALSLFGRPQDVLSHVLVSSPFESHPDFYFPSKSERIIQTFGPNPQPLDCRNAEVRLANIPFVRLRDGLPLTLRQGACSFSETVQLANRSLERPCLELKVGARQVLADGQAVNLGETSFVVLLWLAERTRAGRSMVDWGQSDAVDDFLHSARRVINPMSGKFEKMEASLEPIRTIAVKLRKYFEPHKTRINNALRDALGESSAKRYAIDRVDTSEGYSVRLPLEPDQIKVTR